MCVWGGVELGNGNPRLTVTEEEEESIYGDPFPQVVKESLLGASVVSGGGARILWSPVWPARQPMVGCHSRGGLAAAGGGAAARPHPGHPGGDTAERPGERRAGRGWGGRTGRGGRGGAAERGGGAGAG